MKKDYFILQCKLIEIPVGISILDFVLWLIGGMAILPEVAISGCLCFVCAADILLGKSLVGDNAVLMHLLPVSPKEQVISKILLLGSWSGLISVIPIFFAMKGAGWAIDTKAVLKVLFLTFILFCIGCFFAGFILLCQLYLHPLLKKLPTLVTSLIGVVLTTGLSAGVVFALMGMKYNEFLNLFAMKLLLIIFFGGGAFLMSRVAVQCLEQGYDV